MCASWKKRKKQSADGEWIVEHSPKILASEEKAPPSYLCTYLLITTTYYPWATYLLITFLVCSFTPVRQRRVAPSNTESPLLSLPLLPPPQWGAADAEIKVPPGENTELNRSRFKAWCRSVYSHTCYAYCQGFLACLFLPFQSIHLHFFQNSLDFFLCWLWLTLVPV